MAKAVDKERISAFYIPFYHHPCTHKAVESHKELFLLDAPMKSIFPGRQMESSREREREKRSSLYECEVKGVFSSPPSKKGKVPPLFLDL